MSTYNAGGADKLGVIRYGRDLLTRHERIATTANILPGMVVQPTQDANGNDAFEPHAGAADNDVYIAVEARGRGMDAQDDTGYEADNDLVIAVQANNGAGLNLLLDDGQTVVKDADLAVSTTDAGKVVDGADVDAGITVAYADEDLDLSGGEATDELVATRWSEA